MLSPQIYIYIYIHTHMGVSQIRGTILGVYSWGSIYWDTLSLGNYHVYHVYIFVCTIQTFIMYLHSVPRYP